MSTAREFMDAAGDMMRRERKLLKLTQGDVAAALGVGDATYSDYERGITMMDARTYHNLRAYFHREHVNRGIPNATRRQQREMATV